MFQWDFTVLFASGTHPVNHINEGLGIVSGEIFKHRKLITIREDGLDQINAFMCRKGGADQPFPCRRVPKLENAVKPWNERWGERGTDELRSVCKTSEAFGRE